MFALLIYLPSVLSFGFILAAFRSSNCFFYELLTGTLIGVE